MDLSDIYQQIAHKIKTIIKEDWSEATLEVERADGSIEFIGKYSTPLNAKKTNQAFSVDYSFYKLFKQLHQITSTNLKNNWNRAKYTLYSDGNFEIDFEWDQDLADEIERLGRED